MKEMKSFRAESMKGWLFLMTAALIITACSSNDDIAVDDEPQPADPPPTYTISIDAARTPDANLTRALGLDGNTLNASWAVGDVVEAYLVSHNNPIPGEEEGSGGEGTGTGTGTGTTPIGETEMSNPTYICDLTAASSGVSTKLEGTINYALRKGDKLRLYCISKDRNYDDQDGTLEYIAGNCDYAEADVVVTSVTSSGVGYIVSTTPATFVNQQAIVKFSLKKLDGTPLEATELAVKYYNTTYTVTPTAAASDFYVAIPGKSSKDVMLTATTANGTYIYTKSSVTFANGKYYAINVKMIKATIITSDTEIIELKNGDAVTGTGGANTQLKIAGGATVTLSGVTNNSLSGGNQGRASIECIGDATIILADGTTNTFKSQYERAAVYIPSGHTLTIKGNGTLIADNSGAYGAGIGGSYQQNCGNIRIEGGTVTATGGYAAGIGSGNNKHSCGTITITGGTVTATGSVYAAGIGGGEDGSCGTISITGGTVTATGGDFAAGIGSGHAGEADATCGDISISGGEVTATGGVYAAGIGSGNGYYTGENIYVSSCGVISITGGTVTAKGGDNAAGIGGGRHGKFTSISIGSGITSVTATRSNADSNAPIGKGSNDQGSGAVVFGGETMHNGEGDNWSYWPTNEGTYGGILVTVTNGTDFTDQTWTLTPVQ